MKLRFFSVLILGLAVVCLAQTGLMGGSDGVHQINTQTLGTGQVIVGTGGNFAIDPWALSRGGIFYDDGERKKLQHLKVSATGNFFGAVGLTRFIDIGAALNINYDRSYAGSYWEAAGNIRQGDLDLWAKARAPFFSDSSVFSLAGQFELYLPIGVRSIGIRPRHAWYIHGKGETHPYTAGEVVVGMSAVTTVDLTKVNVPLRWNANIGFVYANEGSNTLVYGTGIDWDMFKWMTSFVEYSGEFRVENNGLPIDFWEDPMTLTPGLRFHLPWNLELSGGIDFSVRMLRTLYDRDKEMKDVDKWTIGYTDQKGYKKTYGYTPAPTYALTGLLTWKFGIADKVSERQCPQGLPPEEPRDTVTVARTDTIVHVDTVYTVDTVVQKQSYVKVDSLPDSDNDGVSDDRDKCPDTPAGITVDTTGCPRDFDGDGVPDHKDMCPNTQPNIGVDSTGCAMDEDRDGVADTKDLCPATPKNAPVDTTGCPMDSDRDGIPDYQDKCPNTLRGVKIDKKGCPVNKREDLERLKKGINFKSGSTVLTKASYRTLDDIVKLLTKFGDVSLEIQGHTDNVGGDEYNENLSQGRAQSAVDYLIRKGIPVERLRAVGFGPRKPIADNKTKKGRAKNRRVELIPFYKDDP